MVISTTYNFQKKIQYVKQLSTVCTSIPHSLIPVKLNDTTLTKVSYCHIWFGSDVIGKKITA